MKFKPHFLHYLWLCNSHLMFITFIHLTSASLLTVCSCCTISELLQLMQNSHFLRLHFQIKSSGLANHGVPCIVKKPQEKCCSFHRGYSLKMCLRSSFSSFWQQLLPLVLFYIKIEQEGAVIVCCYMKNRPHTPHTPQQGNLHYCVLL